MSELDSNEIVNEMIINAYDVYLNAMTPFELFDYFTRMDKKELVDCIKLVCGNDGKEDCNFEY